VDEVHYRDNPLIEIVAIMIAADYVITNLLADIATILVTPRLRTRL
jgi:peptide/nickel transport system permease protein